MSDREQRLRAFYEREAADRQQRRRGSERLVRLRDVVAHLQYHAGGRVLEVGCGTGQEGLLLQGAGLDYLGVDVTTASLRMCRAAGLVVARASATALPIADASVDAVWTMSTLMHLEDQAFAQAVREIRRVTRPGGIIAIGVWGNTINQHHDLPDGRYFRHRTDNDLQDVLAPLGQLMAFDTWAHQGDGVHYQYALIPVPA